MHQNFENRMWVYFVIFTYLIWSRWTCWRSEKRLINQIWIACKNCNCWSEVFTLRRKDVVTEQIVLFHRHPTWADFSSCWKKFPRQKIIIIIIKFPYNARLDWLKQRTLSENKVQVNGIKLASKFLLRNFDKFDPN